MLFFCTTSDMCDHLVYVADLLCFEAFILSLSFSQFAYLLFVCRYQVVYLLMVSSL